MTNELPDKSKIKLIVTDLDGTLLNSEHNISEKTKTTINKILEKYPDLHFVIATGRGRNSALQIRESLGIKNRLNTESILCNGCILNDSNNNIIWERTLPIDFVKKFHNLLKRYPDSIYSFTHDYGIVTFEDILYNICNQFTSERIDSEDKEEYIQKVISGEISKPNAVVYCFIKEKKQEILNELEELRKEYNLDKYQYYPHSLEYTTFDSNKGTGLNKLIEILNISKDEVLAFGDNTNDIELFKNSGWPIAMENACNELKQYAKFITKQNNEDGVAYILEKIFLENE